MDKMNNETLSAVLAEMREALTAFVGYLTQKRIDEVWAKTTLPEPASTWYPKPRKEKEGGDHA